MTLSRLLATGAALVGEGSQEAVLKRVLEHALELTGARHAALGVLDADGDGVERCVALGLDPAGHREIGDVPRGRGVLGVPIVIHGRAWGTLHLSEKRDRERFTVQDAEAATILAQWAAIAIEHARVRESREQCLEQFEQAVGSLGATREITEAIGGPADLQGLLDLIIVRAGTLVRAESLLIMLREGDDLVVAACGGLARASRGWRLSIAGSASAEALERGLLVRTADVAAELRIHPAAFGAPDVRTALLVPMLHRSSVVGILAAANRDGDSDFSEDEERLLWAFAQSAATAVAVDRSVEADRLRMAIAAADAERAGSARELAGRTLERLGGVRVLLASTADRNDAATKDDAMRCAIEQIEAEIADLRSMISDLRSSLLDDVGLVAAIEQLVERYRGDGLRVQCDVRLPAPTLSGLSQSLETTLYRVVQEALANVVKHAGAASAGVLLRVDDGELLIEVRDDGRGFDPRERGPGFGLPGLRARVALAGGTLVLESDPRGTLLRARLPASRVGANVIALRRRHVGGLRNNRRRGSHVG